MCSVVLFILSVCLLSASKVIIIQIYILVNSCITPTRCSSLPRCQLKEHCLWFACVFFLKDIIIFLSHFSLKYQDAEFRNCQEMHILDIHFMTVISLQHFSYIILLGNFKMLTRFLAKACSEHFSSVVALYFNL